MRLFRRKPKQVVGEREIEIDEVMVASILEAQRLSRPRRRRRYICRGTNIREALRDALRDDEE